MNATQYVAEPANSIRGLLNEVLDWRRELMDEALDRLVRQCDAKLPRVAPSLFEERVTERRWLAYLRDEELRAAKSGDEMSALARDVWRALRDPRCKKLELVVERWLPDEDPLREVVIATRDAVDAWWRAPSTSFNRAVMRLLSIAGEQDNDEHCALLSAFEYARAMIGGDIVDEFDGGAARSHDRSPAMVREAARRASVTLATDSRAARLRAVFEAIANGAGTAAIFSFEDGLTDEQRKSARLRRSAAIRVHYPSLDLERVWLSSRC